MSAGGGGGHTMFSGGRWMFILSLLMVVGSASASSDVASGLTELSKCGDECTFWLDTKKMMFKTGGPCTCSSLDLNNKGIAKIANGTVIDMPNLQYLYLNYNEIADLEPGWVRNVPRLYEIYLNSNKFVKLANGFVKDMPNLGKLQLARNEIAEFEPGWASIVPKLWMISLRFNKITQLQPGVFSQLSKLNRLDISANLLGCVSGIADDVNIDPSGNLWGEGKTPRCPENCIINTYYDADNHVCLSCPENTYTDGIGAVNCTALSVMPTTTTTTTPTPTTTTSATTTTPVPLCDGATSPFILPGDTLCVPNNLYPAPNVMHCVFDGTWEDVVENKHLYKTGGLGRKMRDEWEVWLCMEHPCATEKGDRVCFTYSETHHVFVPWGYNSHLRILKKK